MRMEEEQEAAGRTGGGAKRALFPLDLWNAGIPSAVMQTPVAMNGIGYLLYCGFVCGCQAEVPEPVLSPNARVCAGARYSNNL